MANIPPWMMSAFQSLPEETQTTLVTVGAKAALDPWFGSIASVPLALQLVFLPHLFKLSVVLPLQQAKYDNVMPRYVQWDEKIKSPNLANFVKRCVSCHENAWEAFISFAPAVILCKMQKANALEVRELCFKFLKLRFVYTICYVFLGQWKAGGFLRTLVFFAAMDANLRLYLKALMA